MKLEPLPSSTSILLTIPWMVTSVRVSIARQMASFLRRRGGAGGVFVLGLVVTSPSIVLSLTVVAGDS